MEFPGEAPNAALAFQNAPSGINLATPGIESEGRLQNNICNTFCCQGTELSRGAPIGGAVNVLIADVVPNRINSSRLRPHAHHELIIMRS
jgi:hypothetical protein